MTFLSSLLTWANVPFVIAFGVAVLFVALQLTGLLGLLAGGGDHEGDADHDVDGGDADADADHDAGGDDGDADHEGGDDDGDADHDADHEQQHAGSVGKDLLGGMGVGTMPMSIVWQSFAVCFGLGGITTNAVYFSRTGTLPTSALAISAPVAIVFAYAATRLVSKVFGRFAPTPGKTSTSRRDLVGKTGMVISSKVGAEFGEVRLTDATGNVLRVICRTLPDEQPIMEGREVVFVDYDREKDLLFVAPFDIDAPRRKPRVRLSAEGRAGLPPSEKPPPQVENESAEAEKDRSKAVS